MAKLLLLKYLTQTSDSYRKQQGDGSVLMKHETSQLEILRADPQKLEQVVLHLCNTDWLFSSIHA